MSKLTNAFAGLARPDGDASGYLIGTVAAVDYEARRVEVDLGGETLLAPYITFIDYFTIGSTVLLAKTPTGPIALGVLGQALAVSADAAAGTDPAPVDLSLARSGSRVTASCLPVVSATQYRWRTSLNGGSTWAPTVVTTNPAAEFGIGEGKTLTVQVAALVAGVWTAWSTSASTTYPLPSATTEQFTTIVQPVDSGTYRVDRAAWARWNVDRYNDGDRTVYQGDAYGSGTLIGWAGFGDRIKDLGAEEITRAVLKVRRNVWGIYGVKAALAVRGSSAGTQPAGAPPQSGDTVSTPAVSIDQWTSVVLTASMREGLRTGSIKGLTAVGSTASGWWARSGSMVLEISGRKRT